MDRNTPELSARSRRMFHGLDDIELSEDVISVVVDFLNWKLEDGSNDFSLLANAAQISRGFRYHVKRRRAGGKLRGAKRRAKINTYTNS